MRKDISLARAMEATQIAAGTTSSRLGRVLDGMRRVTAQAKVVSLARDRKAKMVARAKGIHVIDVVVLVILQEIVVYVW